MFNNNSSSVNRKSSSQAGYYRIDGRQVGFHFGLGLAQSFAHLHVLLGSGAEQSPQK